MNHKGANAVKVRFDKPEKVVKVPVAAAPVVAAAPALEAAPANTEAPKTEEN
jgi:hypothetical protein